MKKNRLVFTSALLAAFTALVHTIGGTLEIHFPLLSSPLPESIRLLMYACWHLVTVTLILSAIALFLFSESSKTEANSSLLVFIGALWVSFGAVFILVTLYFVGFKGLWIFPQWILLIPTGLLTLLGVKNRSRN